jgi:tripartite ATP-independent transporter DctM subunit
MNAILLASLFVLFLLIGVPVAFSLALSSLLYMIFLTDVPMVLLAQRISGAYENLTIIAIPLYVLVAELMNMAGITDRIFSLARNLVGWLRGGLAQVNIIASIIFAGMSGSGLADVMGLGRIEIKAMKDAGYDPDFSAAVTGSSSIIGPIIPPSIPMILYGMLAEQSVGKLFIAGTIPGLLMGFSLMILVHITAKKRNYPKDQAASLAAISRSIMRAFLPLMTPFIILGGIVGGIFTPTEAAGVAAAYAFILGWVVYRDISLRDIPVMLASVAEKTATILFIFGTAAIFSYLVTLEQIPEMLRNFIINFTDNKIVVLLIINVFLLLLGCFLDPGPVIVIAVPILIPLAMHFDINLIQFGVVVVLNVMVGVLTPPMGLQLFALTDIANIPFDRVVKAIIPFYIPLLIVLLLMTLFPDFVLWLPDLLMSRN